MQDIESLISLEPRKRSRRRQRRSPEEEFSRTGEKIIEKTADFMMLGIGVSAIAGIGSAFIGAIKPK